MKNIKFEVIELSSKTNIKIIIKIYYLTFKKYLSNVLNFNIIKYGIPVFALSIMFFSWITIIWNNDSSKKLADVSTIKSISIKKVISRMHISKTQKIIDNRILSLKSKTYKYKSILRKIKLRQKNI